MLRILNCCASARPAFLLLFCLLLTDLATAQGNGLAQTIKGVVIDQASEEPVIAANILIVGTDPALGAATDYNGSFRIEKVPVGRHSLRISCLGYEDAFINELEVQ